MSNRRIETETEAEIEEVDETLTATEQDMYMGRDPAIVAAAESMNEHEAKRKARAPLTREEKRELARKAKERQAFERTHVSCFLCKNKHREFRELKNDQGEVVRDKKGAVVFEGIRTRKNTLNEIGNWHKVLPVNFKEPVYFCNFEHYAEWADAGRPRVEKRRVGDTVVKLDVYHEYLLPWVGREYIAKVLVPRQLDLQDQRRVEKDSA